MSDFKQDAEQVANKLRKLGSIAPQKAKSGLAAAASAICSQAKALAPRRTGHLKHSISQSVYPIVGGMKAVIGTNVHYARYVEEGTKPHPIVPKRAGGVLRWVVGNRLVYNKKGRINKKASKQSFLYAFARKVNHPGTKPQPYLSRAFEIQLPKIISLLTSTLLKEGMR